MSTVLVPLRVIEQTLSELQRVGKRHSECVALWIGDRNADGIHVKTLWVPEQETGYDIFRIPESSMEKLFRELRAHRLMIAAQVHTHPRRAFHSKADDEWAIVRHMGALSLVIPYFALRTVPDSFKTDTAVFVLSPENEWVEASQEHVENLYRIIP
jgi:proteasome lid subunit RPN8/RPN11